MLYKSIKDRFESHFIYLLPSTCIITDYKKEQRGGHTEVKVHGKQVRAHRLAWTLYKGVIPDGKQVNHTCHNPKCINTDHMYIGTQKDNVHDMIIRGTFTPIRGCGSKYVPRVYTKQTPEQAQEVHKLACKKWRLKQKELRMCDPDFS